jgi:hypothetical protein
METDIHGTRSRPAADRAPPALQASRAERNRRLRQSLRTLPALTRGLQADNAHPGGLDHRLTYRRWVKAYAHDLKDYWWFIGSRSLDWREARPRRPGGLAWRTWPCPGRSRRVCPRRRGAATRTSTRPAAAATPTARAVGAPEHLPFDHLRLFMLLTPLFSRCGAGA